MSSRSRDDNELTISCDCEQDVLNALKPTQHYPPTYVGPQVYIKPSTESVRRMF